MSQVPAGDDKLDPALIKLGLVVVIGVFMSVLDTTIVNVALDTLGRDLDAPLSTIQWVATGYLLALSLVIPLSGWGADRFGAKRLFLLSLVLFTAGSVLCGVAWNAESLILFRVLQGAGGALVMPVGQAITTRAAGRARTGRMMAVIGVPALLGPVLGPVLGGLIVDNASWRWIFFVNVPVGIIGVLLAVRVIPADQPRPAEPLDVRGLVLLSPALALLVYGLSEAGVQGTPSATGVWAPMAAGAVLTVLFLLSAARARERALVPITYFRDRPFAGASGISFIFGVAIFGGMLLLPLYYQQVRGLSALETGLLMAPQGLGACVAMPLAGSITDRLGPRRVVLVGTLVMLLGTVAYTQVTPSTPYWLLVASMFARGLGLGASMMPAIASAYRNLQLTAIPRATTAVNIFQRVGGSVGTALVSVLLIRGVADRSDGRPPTLAMVSSAFGATFWWVFGLTALSLLAVPLLPDSAAGSLTGGQDEKALGAGAALPVGGGSAGLRPPD